MARFLSSLYGTDTRPEKPAKWKKGDDTPEGGFRSKTGVKRIGQKAEISADTFAEAAAKVAELVAEIPAKAQADIVRVKVERDTSDPSSGGNPFLS